ncbi:hypothetical protein CJU90_1042 [Yarrowia sp. C11]|nr:hypothetical protein CKK34_2455 [Yarrowia sp. E02]KAG5373348.1 hypothetical protein CJU90_1042 [Yarrowia sp. C11]
MNVETTPEPHVNEENLLEDLKRQVDEAETEKRKLELQVEQLQEENCARIQALEDSFKVIMKLVVALGERIDSLEM